VQLYLAPRRVSVHVDAARVPHAVRLLHDTFLGPAVPATGGRDDLPDDLPADLPADGVADVVPIPVPALDTVDADGAYPRGESVR
jgi:hypothetical protein